MIENTTEAKRLPGRPKALTQSERRQRILDAAGDLFIEAGYEATDMKGIAERCGMSKKTLYQVFQSKEDLFTTLVCDPQEMGYGSSAPDNAAPAAETLEETLFKLARWVLLPRQIGLTRLIVAESGKTPELAEQFRTQAIDTGRQAILTSLNSAYGSKHGQVELDLLASILFGAVIGDLQIRALSGENIDEAREDGELRKRITRVVKTMLPSMT